jgi:HEPN domain-containing protein
MPPERFAPDEPREWLRQARVDLRVARLAPDDMEREPFAFHAQQAAEKALKAVLLTRGIRFPFVHDLERLLELLERDGVYPPGPVHDAGRLTGYAVLTRYPHDDAVTEDEFRQAMTIAEAVVRWAEAETRA